ncbi:hypothetical protein ACFVIM_11245 [Streptomyces sp. NPDC057638]|uniref:hypothetical protein n=1 Tax=Streptomyces sp. NPDC057638 TaxID=3346190 RepID=UPI00367613D3
MSGPPVSYLCYVLVEGPVHGSRAVLPYILDTTRTRSQEDALVWLRQRARWVADRLDPDPAVSPWVTELMRMGRVPVPDAPTEIRVWCDDPGEERAARARLEQGVPVSVVVPDGPDRYTLAICPQRARVLLVLPNFPLQPRRR